MSKASQSPRAAEPSPNFAIEPSGIDTMLRIAADHYAARKPAMALEVLRGLVILAPNDARPYKLLGTVLFMQARQVDAAKAYERAAEIDPDDPYVRVALGELYLIMVQPSRSFVHFEHLRKLDPRGEHPASGRARYLIQEHLGKGSRGDVGRKAR